MSDTLQRMTDEFRRLDDELAAAVTLPAVDKVIRRAGTLNRASTAAAAAVLTVGTLSGLTAVAQASTPTPSSDVAAPVLPPAASTPTETTQSTQPSVAAESQPVAIDVPAAPVYQAPARPVPGPRVLPPPPPPVPPAPEKKPSGGKEGDSDNNDNNDNNNPTKPKPKPTPPTKPTKPTPPTKPSDPPTSEPSDPPSSQPQDPPSSDPEPEPQTQSETTTP